MRYEEKLRTLKKKKKGEGCRVGILCFGWGKKRLNPELHVNLFYIGFFIRKVPLARFEFWSNKKMIFGPSGIFKGIKKNYFGSKVDPLK